MDAVLTIWLLAVTGAVIGLTAVVCLLVHAYEALRRDLAEKDWQWLPREEEES